MTRPFSPDDRPRRRPGAQLITGPSGEIVITTHGQMWRLKGISIQNVDRLLAVVDGRRTVQEICRAVVNEDTSETILRLLELLHGPVLVTEHIEAPTGLAMLLATPGQAINANVSVLANGELGAAIAKELSKRGVKKCTIVQTRSFASCGEPSFLGAVQKRVLGKTERLIPEVLPGAQLLDDATPEMLIPVFDSHDIIICALESVYYRAILDVNQAALRARRPCVMMTVDGDQVILGPTVMTGQSACFACALISTALNGENRAAAAELLPLLSTQRLADRTLQQFAAARVCSEVARIATNPPPALARTLVRISADNDPVEYPLLGMPDCPFCGKWTKAGVESNAAGIERRSAIVVTLESDLRASYGLRGEPAASDGPLRTVGILGGGTAGYMAALALQIRRPELAVTLIESSKIPIIGVGEATTPRLLDFLHARRNLGLDIVDFYRRVLPTWKLGIRFFWGLPGAYEFNGAFQFSSLLEPMVYNGNIEGSCMGSLLMAQNRVPVFKNADGSINSYLHRVPFAYHLDNIRYVRYLKEESERRGIRLLDRAITDVKMNDDGENVLCLIDDGGERHEFDLYVDASGFRSVLLEQKLGSKFVSFGSSLFTDSAVMANVAHHGVVKPYTTAECMDNGWCWNIPFEDCDHRGYVFSSAFCSPDQAVEEMRKKNPGMSDPWSLRFRSGRHEHFWKGNVVGVGNAYGFVEPLESTGLEMLNIELDLITRHFPTSRMDRGIQQGLTRKMNEMWDNIRGFLAIHYKFNRKFDTPFWKHCRGETDLANGEARVAVFQERAPLMYSSGLFRSADPYFNVAAPSDFFSQEYCYDIILCGMQVPGRYLTPYESREDFQQRQKRLYSCAEWALPQAEALRLLRDTPELLVSVFENEDSWIHLRRY